MPITAAPITQEQEATSLRRARAVATSIRIHCGCKETFTNVPDAEQHARATSHTLTVLGTIRATR